MIAHGSRVARVSRDVQLVLFNKFDEAQIRALEERRIADLLDRRCDQLTPEQERELDGILAQRRREIQAGWSPRVECKRRGLDPKGSTFLDGHNRLLPRVVALPVDWMGDAADESEDDG